MGEDHHVVVTGVRNRIHLVYIASYLRSLLDEPCQSLTVAHVGGGQGLGGIVVSEDDVRSLLPADPRLSITFPVGGARWRLPPDRAVSYVAVGAPGLKPYGRLVAANHGRRFRTVVTDEGLGSYGDLRARRAAWQRQGVRQPWRAVRSLAVEAGLRGLTTQRWALYRETANGWAVDEQVAAEFRGLPVSAVTPGRETAVLLTQPWPDLGVVTRDDYLAHVAEVERWVRERGLRLLVRPHPGEDPHNYRDFDLVEGVGPAELDPQVVGAELVLGGPSTALLNLAAVHHRPALLISPAQADLTALLGARQLSLVTTFVQASPLSATS